MKTLRRSIAAALAIHAGLLAALWLVRRAPAPAAESVENEPAIDVAIEDPASSEPSPPAGQPAAESARGAEEAARSAAPARAAKQEPRKGDESGTRLAEAETRRPSGGSRSDDPGVPSEPAAPSPSPSPSGAPSSGVMLVAPNLGIGASGTNPLLARGALPDVPNGEAPAAREPTEAERLAESKRRIEQSFRQAAHDRDRALGLGPEGPVLTALGDATSGGTAPIRGRAVFLAIANGAGEVVAIDVLACDGARSAWADTAAMALGALKGKKLRMPGGATRAEMQIEVTSAWKMPNGQDPGADVSVLGVPVAKGEGKDSTKVEILNPIPKLETVDLGNGVKIPVPVVSMTIFGTNGDPSNIGAKPRRIVHTRLVDSKVM